MFKLGSRSRRKFICLRSGHTQTNNISVTSVATQQKLFVLLKYCFPVSSCVIHCRRMLHTTLGLAKITLTEMVKDGHVIKSVHIIPLLKARTVQLQSDIALTPVSPELLKTYSKEGQFKFEVVA